MNKKENSVEMQKNVFLKMKFFHFVWRLSSCLFVD